MEQQGLLLICTGEGCLLCVARWSKCTPLHGHLHTLIKSEQPHPHKWDSTPKLQEARTHLQVQQSCVTVMSYVPAPGALLVGAGHAVGALDPLPCRNRGSLRTGANSAAVPHSWVQFVPGMRLLPTGGGRTLTRTAGSLRLRLAPKTKLSWCLVRTVTLPHFFATHFPNKTRPYSINPTQHHKF